MSTELKVTLNGKELRVRAGTRIEELFANHHHPGPFPALGAIVNKRIVSLSYPLKAPADVTSIDITRREGMDIYRRSASAILCAALLDIAPHAKSAVGQSIGNGYFFDIDGAKVDQAFLTQLDRRMREFVQEHARLEMEWTTVDEAIDRFTERGAHDKAKLLSQGRRAEVVLFRLGKFLDVAHGPVASSAGLIDRFALHPYEHGLVLDFPDEHGELADTIPPHPKLFATYVESKRWNELVKTQNIADLNEHCMEGSVSDLIRVTEALHEK
ncbi:MAG: hypothetical protein HY465_02435, partial [Deltaproteobacteria bacterium]|nr:hypothetical protein [Deltaproteobacteria bacterium]